MVRKKSGWRRAAIEGRRTSGTSVEKKMENKKILRGCGGPGRVAVLQSDAKPPGLKI
jgi:hypothetical protein